MNAPYLVVGAGPSGLGCALQLAATHDVSVLDRVPVPGGESGWSSPEVAALVEQVTQAGARLLLGQAALRWEPGRLLVAAPGRINWLAGAALFFAGGLRPATAADLHITGDRPAGVLPATVAQHLLAAQARLWGRIVVVGDGPWAHHVAQVARAAGTTVVGISTGPAPFAWADETLANVTAVEVIGRARVTAVKVLTAPGARREIPCEAVILAADPRPNRNVLGALNGTDPGVTFVQPTTGATVADRAELGRLAALKWQSENGENR
jgi:Pyridine nucleotide-disulphide oxidoreductase